MICNGLVWTLYENNMQNGRVCNRCKQHKPWEAFAINKKGVNDRKSICKVCSNDSQKALAKSRRESDPKLWSAYRREKLLVSKYGITTEIYNQMLLDQGGCCAICKRKENIINKTSHFYVDHCHKSGKTRQLLCYYCNSMLGLSFEDPSILRAGADYVEKHR
jgi:hypothetical protein